LIFSSKGTHLGTIRVPEMTTNLHWGDADGKTLYITAGTGVYRIRLAIAGLRP
jgi:gluconolactonase